MWWHILFEILRQQDCHDLEACLVRDFKKKTKGIEPGETFLLGEPFSFSLERLKFDCERFISKPRVLCIRWEEGKASSTEIFIGLRTE